MPGGGPAPGRFGSFGHEYQDALQYARWGIDYLKYDWCNTENINPVGSLYAHARRPARRRAPDPFFHVRVG